MTIKEHKEDIKKFKNQLRYVVDEYNDSFKTMEEFIKHLDRYIIIKYSDLDDRLASASFAYSKSLYIDNKYKGNNFILIKEYFKIVNEVNTPTLTEEIVGQYKLESLNKSSLFAYGVLKELNMEDDIPYELNTLINESGNHFAP